MLRRVLAAQQIRDDVADRLAVGDRRASDTVRVAAPMRPPWVTTNESHTVWSSTSRPKRGLGDAVVLVRDALSVPHRCGAWMSSIEASISRWIPCTWYVSREAVGDDLPVARHRRVVVTAHRKSSSRAHAASSGTPSRYVGERRRVGVEVHEHEPAPHGRPATANSHSRRCEARRSPCATAPRAAGRRGPTPSGGTRSAARSRPGTGTLAQRVAAVTAHVLERAQLAVVAAHDRDRVPAGAVLEPVARLGDVVDRARDLPHPRPQQLVFELGELRRDVAIFRDRDGHDLSNVFGRGGSVRGRPHVEVPQRRGFFLSPSRIGRLAPRRAFLTTDGDVLDQWTEEFRRPKVAVGIETRTVYIHCAKSFRRGRVWEPEAWAETADAPGVADDRRTGRGRRHRGTGARHARSRVRSQLAYDRPE